LKKIVALFAAPLAFAFCASASAQVVIAPSDLGPEPTAPGAVNNADLLAALAICNANVIHPPKGSYNRARTWGGTADDVAACTKIAAEATVRKAAHDPVKLNAANSARIKETAARLSGAPAPTPVPTPPKQP
jgi:hypothetical protein